jgi:trehalose utilization protein
MGLIVLHSGHYSKIFKKLMGTSCALSWRENEKEKCRIWCTDPSHPIAKDMPEYFELQPEEMYGEFFDIPKPDATIFISWFKGGNVFRGGITFSRGKGKIFYFHPGHESFKSFYNKNVQKVIANACKWCKPIDNKGTYIYADNQKELETL